MQVPEREIETLLWAIETLRNRFEWDDELGSMERQDHEELKLIYNKTTEAYFG